VKISSVPVCIHGLQIALRAFSETHHASCPTRVVVAPQFISKLVALLPREVDLSISCTRIVMMRTDDIDDWRSGTE
jgi:hypothetical protein